MMSLFIFFFFFFQAEDGIRDWSVTGVQTCALPICEVAARGLRYLERLGAIRLEPRRRATVLDRHKLDDRSEERRVGKECRSRGWPEHEKKKRRRGEEDSNNQNSHTKGRQQTEHGKR